MTGRIAVATLALAAALGMSACGSDDEHPSHQITTSRAPASATADANVPPVPTVDELNTELGKALDPNVPAAEKAQWLEDGDEALAKDPDMMQKLTQAYQEANATITVTNVEYLGGDTLTAKVDFAVNGGEPKKADVPFVAQDGQWRLQQSWACNGLKNLGQQSPACA